MLPTVIYIAIFSYQPMYGVIIAFKRFNPRLGYWKSPWVGFQYFETFFRSSLFSQLMANTLLLSAYGMVVGYIVTIVLALMLNEIGNKTYKRVVQTTVYAPYFISMVVLVGMINIFFGSSGQINNLLGLLGLEPVQFLSRAKYFRHLYVWTGVWQGAGWGTVIYLAVLSNVDMEQNEAAIIDGASRLQRIRFINLPAILPTATILLIMSMSNIMNVGFEKVFLMQNDLNIRIANVISTYVYHVGLKNGNFPFSAAVGLFNNVINCFLLIVANAIAKRVSDTSLW